MIENRPPPGKNTMGGISGISIPNEVKPALGRTDARFVVCYGNSGLPTGSLPMRSEGQEKLFSAHYERRVIPIAGHFFPREAPDAAVAEYAGGLQKPISTLAAAIPPE